MGEGYAALRFSTGSMYNATVYRYRDGELLSTFAARVNEAGVMLVSNAVQYTAHDGSPEYDAYVRANAFAGDELRIVADGGAGYRARIAGLGTPPAYRG